MKMLNVCFVAVAATFSSALWAGPSVGGGGDVVVLPDDTVVLADPFIDSGSPQPNNMPPLRALNPRILQVINLYNKASSPMVSELATKESDINVALSKLATRNNDLRFYGVQSAEELNQFCAPGGRKIYKLPNGAQVQQVACTAGNETFMVEPLFSRLSLRDQGLLLIHERLTTLRDQYGGKNYQAIARFTTGLNVYLNIYSEQNKKKFRMLSVEEQKILSDLYVAVEEIEKRNSEITDDSFQWMAHRNGGGRTHAAAIIDDSAFISLNSVIGRKSEIADNVKVINFSNTFLLPLVMESGSIISNLNNSYKRGPQAINPTSDSVITLKEGAQLIDVDLMNNTGAVTVGEKSLIKESSINAYTFSSGENANIVDGQLNILSMELGKNVTLKKTTMASSKKVKISDNVVIENTKSSSVASEVNIASGVSIKGSDLPNGLLTIGADSILENVRFSKDTSWTILGSSTTIKDSAIAVDSFTTGSHTKIQDSSLYANQLKLGNFVNFNHAIISYVNLDAKVADRQELINQSVLGSTYEAYYPLGFVPTPVSISVPVENFKCVLNEKVHKKTSAYKKEILNSDNDGLIVTGQTLYQGRVSPFKNEWNYDYNDFRAQLIFKKFKRSDDKNLLMISDDGRFVNPDYKRENLIVDISGLGPCEKSAVSSALKSIYNYNRDVISIPSSGIEDLY